MTNREIVPPEPQSTPPNLVKAWEHVPRWARIVLCILIVAAAILAIFLTL